MDLKEIHKMGSMNVFKMYQVGEVPLKAGSFFEHEKSLSLDW